MRKLFTVAIAASLLAACSNEPANTNTEEKTVEITQSCTYSFNTEASTLHWLAYKHTDKIGVNGTLDSVSVEGMVASTNAKEIFASAKITAFVAGVDSKDAGRDKKIKEIFFGNMANTETISGTVSSVEGNNKAGTGTIALELNALNKVVAFEYTFEGEKLKLWFEVDFNTFQAQKSIEELNKACEERHTGADGESILWPDVRITLISTLDKECK